MEKRQGILWIVRLAPFAAALPLVLGHCGGDSATVSVDGGTHDGSGGGESGSGGSGSGGSSGAGSGSGAGGSSGASNPMDASGGADGTSDTGPAVDAGCTPTQIICG